MIKVKIKGAKRKRDKTTSKSMKKKRANRATGSCVIFFDATVFLFCLTMRYPFENLTFRPLLVFTHTVSMLGGQWKNCQVSWLDL